jgi:hypothetical protein
MPEKETLERAMEDLSEGKSPSTAAGEFVHEEIEHVREGKHGARSPQQAVAIGLSKARRAGIPLPPPERGRVKEETRKGAERDYQKGQSGEDHQPSRRASQAREEVLAREPNSTASHRTLSKQSRAAARGRSSEDRHRSAEHAVQTKGTEGLQSAARKGCTHARPASRRGLSIPREESDLLAR